MATKGNIYVVTMYRWADVNCHSYVHGVFGKKEQSIKEGESERIYRGGTKYYPKILEFTGYGRDGKVILDLPDYPFMRKEQ